MLSNPPPSVSLVLAPSHCPFSVKPLKQAIKTEQRDQHCFSCLAAPTTTDNDEGQHHIRKLIINIRGLNPRKS